MKLLANIALSILISVTSIFALSHYTVEAGYRQVREATWRLDTAEGNCSGIFIKPQLFLTAAHCDGEDLKVAGNKATILKKDRSKDLMLLYVPMQSTSLPVASSRPAVDNPVALAGYPLGMGEVVTEGRMQDASGGGLPDVYMLVTAPGIYGNSGGPVVVRKGLNYEVVGIVSALPLVGFGSPVTHLMLVVNTEAINKFLNE